jgi:two-component system, NtrC family, sensor histidine kinase PilS
MDLRSRLVRLIAARVVVATLLLVAATLVQRNQPAEFPVNALLFLSALVYGLSAVYGATLGLVNRHPWLADVQLGADALLVSGLIGVTGGVASYFSWLYVLPIIAASTIRLRRGALQVAGLSILFYVVLVAAQYLDAAPDWVSLAGLDRPPGRFAFYTVAVNLVGFAAVALLSGSLAERLREADASLVDASLRIEDLRAFNEYVIDGLQSGLVTTDADSRVLTFNRGATGILGVSSEHAVGQDARDLLQLPGGVREELASVGSGRKVRADIDYLTSAGSHLEVGLMVRGMAFPGGETGHLYTFQDVTELRRLERDARLRQRLAAVGEMAAGIAHEIRNPLASMSGSIQVLRQELTLNEEQGQLMDIVLRESDRLNDTIRSFLSYARPQTFAITRLDVATVVQDAARLLRNSPDALETHVVDVRCPAQPVWCDADENQLRQIVWNLSSNGLRAMPDGGRLLLSVETDVSGEEPEVVVSVADEGRGIPAEELDNLFQPFRSTFQGGTGLGLAIVHRIVSDHGGVIRVSSTIDVGTTVRVRLPVRNERDVAAVVPPEDGSIAS